MAAVDEEFSILDEGNGHALLSLRRTTGKSKLVRLEHHKDGTRAWTAYQPSFIGVLLIWLTFGIMLALSFITSGFDLFGGGGDSDPIEKLQVEVRRRVAANRTGAGSP